MTTTSKLAFPFTVRLIHDRVSSDVLGRYVSEGGAIKAAKQMSLEWPGYVARIESLERPAIDFVNGRRQRRKR